MSSIVEDNTPRTVKGKPRQWNNNNNNNNKRLYRTIKRRQPFSGFTSRQCHDDKFYDNINVSSTSGLNENYNVHTRRNSHLVSKSSEKSIYEKTLNMLMTAGQAAFDNIHDEDSNMNIDSDTNDNINNSGTNLHVERPSRTIEYYFSPKVSHK